MWSELKGRGGEAIRDSFSPMDGQRVDEGNGMGRGGEKERGEGGEEQVVGWVQFGRGKYGQTVLELGTVDPVGVG